MPEAPAVPVAARRPRDRRAGPLVSLGRTILPAALLLATAPLAAPAAAQQPASLRGSLAGADGLPLHGAEIRLAGLDIQTTTDRQGRFELRRIPPGQQTVEILHIGYHKVELPLVFMPGAKLEHDLQLQVQALLADTLRVAARAGLGMSPQMRGFNDRRARSQGFFFTRDQILEMQARQFTDVLRRVPGMRIEPQTGPYGTSYVVQLGRSTGTTGSRSCPVLFYVNGAPFVVSPDVGINTFIRPDDVAGVEVYSGASQLPPQFSSTANRSRCGVVVIWTYAGEERKRAGG